MNKINTFIATIAGILFIVLASILSYELVAEFIKKGFLNNLEIFMSMVNSGVILSVASVDRRH